MTNATWKISLLLWGISTLTKTPLQRSPPLNPRKHQVRNVPRIKTGVKLGPTLKRTLRRRNRRYCALLMDLRVQRRYAKTITSWYGIGKERKQGKVVNREVCCWSL